MTGIPSNPIGLVLACVVLAGCTSTAQALNNRSASAPATERVALLRGECATVAAKDKFGPAPLTDACAAMEDIASRRALSTADRVAFARAYQDCLDESGRDSAMIVTRWHRGRPGFYRDARAVCDAHRTLFDLRHADVAAQAR